ncbi:hypothetical protein LWI29_025885 [Acer saccharum]|uniref:Uncharacterized protein n=1 Tax=Acer saccharum TaxID=4024 RepID=A0AA39VGK3_ACESA|nr:hypothetical protein LWI29_025885 [Acer saccharum]
MKKMNIIEKRNRIEPIITITMTDPQTPENLPSSSSPSSSSKSAPERSTKYSGQKKLHYPNPPESTNPDPATLREQWRFAIRQYSRWAPILSLPSSLLLLLPLMLMIIQQQNPSPLIDALLLLQSLLMDLWLDATTVRKMHHCPHCSRSLTTDVSNRGSTTQMCERRLPNFYL